MARKATKSKASRSTKTAASRKRATGTSTRRKRRSSTARGRTTSSTGSSSPSRTRSRRGKSASAAQRVKRATSSAARRASSARTRARSTQAAPRGQRGDAIAVLREDHQRIRQLLGRLHEADTPTQRERALEETRAEIERHTTIEEEIFYPAFRNVAENEHDRELFHEAHEEHNAASMVLKEINVSAEPEVFAARAKVLKEESEMLPRAKQLMPREELLRLGQELTERKRELARNSSGGTLQAVASLVRMPFSS